MILDPAPKPAPIERTMTPFGKNVVLKITVEQQQRASGLYLPEGARVRYDLPKIATVVDCGPDVNDLAPEMEVLVAPFYDGIQVTVGEPVQIVSERAIIAILTDPSSKFGALDQLKRIYQQIERWNERGDTGGKLLVTEWQEEA